jgi:hypothetical protein
MMRKTFARKFEKGQTWVIMAVAITVLIVLLGFAVDSAILFSNYTKLKRAVDAAAVAAANEYKVKNAKANVDDPVNIPMLEGYLTASAKEMLTMHDLNMDTNKISLHVYICEDSNIQNLAPSLYAMCPASGQSPRKLVYVTASEEAPTYFLTLIGINSIPITTNSISEAAPIDLVLVIDTSESMGSSSPDYVPDNFDPAVCNAHDNGDGTTGNCEPLRTAKQAAFKLVNTLFNGYDQVAVVSFAQVPVLNHALTNNMADVKTAINNIQLHDDAPAALLPSGWYNNNWLNPVNPEDRNGDGQDADASVPCTVQRFKPDGTPDQLSGTFWKDWDVTDPNKPCDKDGQLDAFDWNQDGMLDTDYDVAKSVAFVQDPRHEYCSNYAADGTCVSGYLQQLPMSILSTCTGCGIRMATDQLVRGGRSNAVWVMVILSDGVANLTDTSLTYPQPNPFGIPTSYPNGYCGGSINNHLWTDLCLKPTDWPRYCINPTLIPTPPATAVAPRDVCPPGSTPVAFPTPISISPPYNPEDYARDMADRAALLHGNIAETRGSDMSIYTIGLGSFASKGESLMRYIADIGDDGTRNNSDNDSTCHTSADFKECGQYYFTADVNKLGTIFDSIASRIYTKITY